LVGLALVVFTTPADVFVLLAGFAAAFSARRPAPGLFLGWAAFLGETAFSGEAAFLGVVVFSGVVVFLVLVVFFGGVFAAGLPLTADLIVVSLAVAYAAGSYRSGALVMRLLVRSGDEAGVMGL
jgi:hypothetical protein